MNGTKQTGFIPDIVSLFQKYHLLDVFETYIKESVFPSRLTWKKTIKHICGIVEHCSRSLAVLNGYIIISELTISGSFRETNPNFCRRASQLSNPDDFKCSKCR